MNKIKTSEPKPLWKLRCTLGEGTLWVSEHNSIYFVDIKKKKICSFNITNKKKNVLGMMPHPERAYSDFHQSQDGRLIIESLIS